MTDFVGACVTTLATFEFGAKKTEYRAREDLTQRQLKTL